MSSQPQDIRDMVARAAAEEAADLPDMETMMERWIDGNTFLDDGSGAAPSV